MKEFNYHNPVNIEFGIDKLEIIDKLIGDRNALLITTKGSTNRGVAFRIKSCSSNIENTINIAKPNPTFKDLGDLCGLIQDRSYDVIIALGGGSVIDSAKVISLCNGKRDFTSIEDIIRNNKKSCYNLKPIIAIPTTAGSGSEVTPWATIWDTEEKNKYSLHLSNLWSESCICDPRITVSMPRDLTIQTALDALSHSLEAIWNKNANPISTIYAITSAKGIIDALPDLIYDLNNIELRKRVMFSALCAGLAFSNTQTAIAHALSYYITIHKNIPHGIACSFSLPSIIDSIIGKNHEIDTTIKAIFGDLSSNKLRDIYLHIGISTNIFDYNVEGEDFILIDKFLKKNLRASNYIGDMDKTLKTIYDDGLRK